MDFVNHSAAVRSEVRISGAITSRSVLTGKVHQRTGGDSRGVIQLVSPVTRTVTLPGSVQIGAAGAGSSIICWRKGVALLRSDRGSEMSGPEALMAAALFGGGM